MMRPRRSQFLSLALAGVIYFTLSATAEAGFIVATADPLSQNPLVEEVSSSQGQPDQTPIPPSYEDKRSESAPSGMSTPSSLSHVTSGGAAHAMLPTTLIDIPTLLITHLGPEGRPWLPPPFSTGIFRPPRFV